MAEMREPTFLLLSALADGPKHGYAIRMDVESGSDGQVVMRTGTLYAALDRLMATGEIERAGEDVVEGRQRYYYRLTESGAQALAEAAETRRAQAQRAVARLGRAATA